MNYSPRLIDHFRNPRNAGMMRNPDAIGEAEDPECGDLARFFLRIREGRAVDVRYQTYGCGPTIAAASAGSELVLGREITDLAGLTADEVEMAVEGLPVERKHAAQVVAEAIRAASRNFGAGHV